MATYITSANNKIIRIVIQPIQHLGEQPFQIIAVGNISGDTKKTLDIIGHYTWDMAVNSNLIKDSKRSYLYELANEDGKDLGNEGNGEECQGLMALALVCELLEFGHAEIACLGSFCLEASGSMNPVSDITPKVRLLSAEMKPGTMLFFPRVNKSEIDDLLRADLADRGILLKSITTLDEALREITANGMISGFGDLEKKKKPTKKSTQKPRRKFDTFVPKGVAASLLIFALFYLAARDMSEHDPRSATPVSLYNESEKKVLSLTRDKLYNSFNGTDGSRINNSKSYFASPVELNIPKFNTDALLQQVKVNPVLRDLQQFKPQQLDLMNWQVPGVDFVPINPTPSIPLKSITPISPITPIEPIQPLPKIDPVTIPRQITP